MRPHGPSPLVLLAVVLLAGCGTVGRAEHRASQPASSASGENRLNVPTAGWRTDFSRHTVPLSQFLSGGPGKDGIPALDHPSFGRARATQFLQPEEPVIELVVNGVAKAYPIEILIWHEIANDRIGGVPVAVTFCPLCNTAIVFDRRVDGRTLSFGTTGNLRNSDLVMYDRQTESWWQQFGGEAVVGRYAGTQLRELPARILSWRAFSREHPDGDVLQRPTGAISRPYGQNPYAGYDNVATPPFFPAANSGDHRLQPKERVVFVERGSESAAIPFSTLAKKKTVALEVGGHHLVATWHPGISSPLDTTGLAAGREIGSADVRENGTPVRFEEPFWFAVAAFRPHTKIVR